jgi:hypothetical protein
MARYLRIAAASALGWDGRTYLTALLVTTFAVLRLGTPLAAKQAFSTRASTTLVSTLDSRTFARGVTKPQARLGPLHVSMDAI